MAHVGAIKCYLVLTLDLGDCRVLVVAATARSDLTGYWTPCRQNVVVYARMITYNDEEPWPQNLGAVAIAN